MSSAVLVPIVYSGAVFVYGIVLFQVWSWFGPKPIDDPNNDAADPGTAFLAFFRALFLFFWVGLTAIWSSLGNVANHLYSNRTLYALIIFAVIITELQQEAGTDAIENLDSFAAEFWPPINREVILPLSNAFRVFYEVLHPWYSAAFGLSRVIFRVLFEVATECQIALWKDLIDRVVNVFEVFAVETVSWIISLFGDDYRIGRITQALADVTFPLQTYTLCLCEDLVFGFDILFESARSPSLHNGIEQLVNAFIEFWAVWIRTVRQLLAALFGNPPCDESPVEAQILCLVGREPRFDNFFDRISLVFIHLGDWLDETIAISWETFLGTDFLEDVGLTPPAIGRLFHSLLTFIVEFDKIVANALFHIDLVFPLPPTNVPFTFFRVGVDYDLLYDRLYNFSAGIEIFWQAFGQSTTDDIGCVLGETSNVTIRIVEFLGRSAVQSFTDPAGWPEFAQQNLTALLDEWNRDLSRLADCANRIVEDLNDPLADILREIVKTAGILAVVANDLISDLENFITIITSASFRDTLAQLFFSQRALAVAIGNLIRQFAFLNNGRCELKDLRDFSPPLTQAELLPPDNLDPFCCLGTLIDAIYRMFVGVLEWAVLVVIDLIDGENVANIFTPGGSGDFDRGIIPRFEDAMRALTCFIGFPVPIPAFPFVTLSCPSPFFASFVGEVLRDFSFSIPQFLTEALRAGNAWIQLWAALIGEGSCGLRDCICPMVTAWYNMTVGWYINVMDRFVRILLCADASLPEVVIDVFEFIVSLLVAPDVSPQLDPSDSIMRGCRLGGNFANCVMCDVIEITVTAVKLIILFFTDLELFFEELADLLEDALLELPFIVELRRILNEIIGEINNIAGIFTCALTFLEEFFDNFVDCIASCADFSCDGCDTAFDDCGEVNFIPEVRSVASGDSGGGSFLFGAGTQNFSMYTPGGPCYEQLRAVAIHNTANGTHPELLSVLQIDAERCLFSAGVAKMADVWLLELNVSNSLVDPHFLYRPSTGISFLKNLYSIASEIRTFRMKTVKPNATLRANLTLTEKAWRSKMAEQDELGSLKHRLGTYANMFAWYLDYGDFSGQPLMSVIRTFFGFASVWNDIEERQAELRSSLSLRALKRQEGVRRGIQQIWGNISFVDQWHQMSAKLQSKSEKSYAFGVKIYNETRWRMHGHMKHRIRRLFSAYDVLRDTLQERRVHWDALTEGSSSRESPRAPHDLWTSRGLPHAAVAAINFTVPPLCVDISDTELCFVCEFLDLSLNLSTEVIIRSLVEAQRGVDTRVNFCDNRTVVIRGDGIDLRQFSPEDFPVDEESIAGRVILFIQKFVPIREALAFLIDFFTNSDRNDPAGFFFYVDFFFSCGVIDPVHCDEGPWRLDIYSTALWVALTFFVINVIFWLFIQASLSLTSLLWVVYFFTVYNTAYAISPVCWITGLPPLTDCVAADLYCGYKNATDVDCINWNKVFPGLTTDECPTEADDFVRPFTQCYEEPFNFGPPRNVFFSLEKIDPAINDFLLSTNMWSVAWIRELPGFEEAMMFDEELVFDEDGNVRDQWIGCNRLTSLGYVVTVGGFFALMIVFSLSVVAVFLVGALFWLMLVALALAIVSLLVMFVGARKNRRVFYRHRSELPPLPEGVVSGPAAAAAANASFAGQYYAEAATTATAGGEFDPNDNSHLGAQQDPGDYEHGDEDYGSAVPGDGMGPITHAPQMMRRRYSAARGESVRTGTWQDDGIH